MSDETIVDGAGTTPNTDNSQGSWTDSLSDDLRANESLGQYDSLESFVSSSLEAQGKIADLEGSIPKAPEKYEFDTEGLDKDAIDAFSEVAKKLNLTQEQAKAILGFSQERAKLMEQANSEKAEAEKAAREKNYAEAETSLKKEWGAGFEKNLGLVNRMVGKFGNEDITKLLESSPSELQGPIGNNPIFAKFLHSIATQFSEDAFVSGGSTEGVTERPRMSDGRPMLNFPSMQNN